MLDMAIGLPCELSRRHPLLCMREKQKHDFKSLLLKKKEKKPLQTRKYYSDKSKVFIPAMLILLQLQLKGLLLDFL